MPELYLDLNRRLRISRVDGNLSTALEMDGHPVLHGFRLSERDGEDIVWTEAELEGATLVLKGGVEDRWRVRVEIAVAGQRSPRAAWRIEARYLGEEPVETAFEVSWLARLEDAQPFVPGVFYGENRPHGRGIYPRWAVEEEPDDPASSPTWKFRTDRTMNPVAMVRDRRQAAAIIVSDRFSHGPTGLGFCITPERTGLYAQFPYVEEPIAYSPFREGEPAPDVASIIVRPGDTVEMSFEVYTGLSGWRALLRDMYVDDPESLRPWMPGQRAAALAAHGLYTWHYDPAEHMLYETSGFDRYFRQHPRQWDRTNMHVAWNSGMPYAFALARHGARNGLPEYTEAGLSVLDRVATEAIAPCGVFYPQWTREHGWTGGWKMDSSLPPVAQSRTVGEATWFLLQALCCGEPWTSGDRLKQWARAAQSNLDFAVNVQREDGSFGTYYNLETGAVEEWDGAGGLMWIPALLMGARYHDSAGAAFRNRTAYLDAALKAGAFYAQMVRDETVAGAPEDVPYGVTSEDGYDALLAMFHLYEETGDEQWLDLASQAADYTLSFRMSYNATFSPNTLLGRYNYRTKGADIASPSNQHLHNYGYVCIPEMLRLWRLTGDDYYFYRARDHVFCFRQFIAREDGDFNARKGMVSEQYFHTDWTFPKGYVLPLAHAWCAGWIIWVEDWLRNWGTLFFHPERRQTYLLDSVTIVDVDWRGGTITLRNPWETDVCLTAVNMQTEERSTYQLPAGTTHLFQL